MVEKLLHDMPLDARLRDHALTGEWTGYRDCHITPDWVLIYRVADEEIELARLGSHADLFG